MPLLTTPAVPPGAMAALAQPEIHIDGLLRRQWRASDRPAVVAAYSDPAIQRWHCRSMTDEETRDWIAAWPRRWRSETGAGWAARFLPGSGTRRLRSRGHEAQRGPTP